MNYPLITEYIEAIRNAEDNFNELSHLRPVLDAEGNPVMSSGNFAVVFKMTDGKRNYAIKCFTKYQPELAAAYLKIANEFRNGGSYHMVESKYYENELFVCSSQTTETEFPILCMDWIEGETLEQWLIENEQNIKGLKEVYSNFHGLVLNILNSPVAHGDLKPDNIIVENDLSLKLIDLDGMYVSEMYGEYPRENGTPEYSHPLRKQLPFNEYIDDYACIVILLALKLSIVSNTPYSRIIYLGIDNFVDCHSHLKTDKEVHNLFLAYQYILMHGQLDRPMIPYLLNVINEDQRDKEQSLKHRARTGESAAMVQLASYYRSIGDYSNAYKWGDFALRLGNVNAECELCHCYRSDGQFALFSGFRGGVKVLHSLAPRNVSYALCNIAEMLPFPKTDGVDEVERIKQHRQDSREAFSYAIDRGGSVNAEHWIAVTYYGRDDNKATEIDKSAASKGLIAAQTCLGKHYFEDEQYRDAHNYYLMAANQDNAESMYYLGVIYEHGLGITADYEQACYWYNKAANKKHAKSLSHLGCLYFNGKHIAQDLKMATSYWLEAANLGEDKAQYNISICYEKGYGLNQNSELAFSFLQRAVSKGNELAIKHLREKYLPIIENTRLNGEEYDDCFIDEYGVKYTKDKKCLLKANLDLTTYNLPSPTIIICDRAFMGCKKLKSLYLSPSLLSIGSLAFCDCQSLKAIQMPDTILKIGSQAFFRCTSLISFDIPKALESILPGLFGGCSSLKEIYIPDTIKQIWNGAFEGCSSLQSIDIPNSVTSIGNSAFSNCKSLQSVKIPNSVESIGEDAFDDCKSLQTIIIPKGTRDKFEDILWPYHIEEY